MKKRNTILCYISIFFLSGTTCLAQFRNSGFLVRDSFSRRQGELITEFGNNKKIENSIELECLTALSFFPELKNTTITFKFGKPISTMVSRPDIRSLVKRQSEREYVIIIRLPNTSKTGLEWTMLNFSALVGWIGHELSHICQYRKKTNTGILVMGISYIFPANRMKIEKETDINTIRHGLGQALYDGTYFTLQQPKVSICYKRKLQKYYLEPEEILREIGYTETTVTR